MAGLLDDLEALSCDNRDHTIMFMLNFMEKLSRTEDELQEVLAKTRDMLSEEIVEEMLVTVKHRNFVTLFGNKKKFDFSFHSLDKLVEDKLVEADKDPRGLYMMLFEMLFFLPKNDHSSEHFKICMVKSVDYFSDKLDFENAEHGWVLETGHDFRVALAYVYIPRPKNNDEQLKLEINRSNLLDDSIQKITQAEAQDLAEGVYVTYADEEGMGDGVRRDWFVSLAGQISRYPDAFKSSGDELARDDTRIYPNEGLCREDAFYICFGRLIVMALIHKVQLGITLDNVVYVKLAGKETVELKDISGTTPIKYQSYHHILGCADNVLSEGCYYFSTDDEDGDNDDELIPGRRVTTGDRYVSDEIFPRRKVTTANRAEFVAKKIQKEFVGSIERQTDSIIQGTDDLLTAFRQNVFKILKLEDFDYLIRGIRELNVDEWMHSTNYEGYIDTDSQVAWFWQCVADLSEEKKRKLLFFWTSVMYLPRGGFQALDPPLLLRNWQDVLQENLPRAQTCFNTIMFPPYQSYEVMKSKLLTAMDEGTFQLE